MKKFRITRYQLDKQDKRYIENLLREKQLTITYLCKKHKYSRTAFYDTLNGKLYFNERLAKILDDELDTHFTIYMKGGKNVAVSKE